MKRDVGMVCQKYMSTQQGNEGKYTKLIHPYIFSHYSEDAEMGLCVFTFTFRSSNFCVLCGMPFLHLFSDFSFLFLYFFINFPSCLVKHCFNQVQPQPYI